MAKRRDRREGGEIIVPPRPQPEIQRAKAQDPDRTQPPGENAKRETALGRCGRRVRERRQAGRPREEKQEDRARRAAIGLDPSTSTIKVD